MSKIADYAWAAGFFDGEGSVSIKKSSASKTGNSFQLLLHAAQVDPEPLEKMKNIFGGNLCSYERQRKGLSYAERYWEWGLVGSGAKQALLAMLPYLTIKRERAEMAVDFQSVLEERGRGGKLSIDEVETRKAFYDGMRQLNWLATSEARAAAETKSKGTANGGDAIVRSAEMENLQKPAEMTGSLLN